MLLDSTKRFSDRVTDYIKYRPRYPETLVAYLEEEVGLSADTVIGDVGSGTGILTELFLQNGNPVFAVEPNEAMRIAAEALLAGYENFTSISGTAESTNLADDSVELIVAGQAFHWFDPPKARAEFARILKSGGHVVLAWNSRRKDTPFMRAYEALLFEYADDYKSVGDRNVKDEHIADFFAPQPMVKETLTDNHIQTFDFEGLKGRALSSSYSPALGHPKHRMFIEQLQQLFEAYQVDGAVTVEYRTRIYSGRLSP